MSLMDLTLQDKHFQQLSELLRRDDGKEAAAYLLCGKSTIAHDPWERRTRCRLLSYEVLPVPDDEMVSASETHVTWQTDSFVRLLKRAKHEGLVVGIVHTHPDGTLSFSSQDDDNERDLLRLAQNRNGPDESLLSLLMVEGCMTARLWMDAAAPIRAETVRTVGKKFVFHSSKQSTHVEEVFNRQSLAFGKELCSLLKGLKVGVVGCGGTGSATATLLARMGVGQLLLIDDDIVEVTNLNRLHGAHRKDADAMRPKVQVLTREITDWGIGARVVPMQCWVGDPACRDALKSCDVIFGCTDDHEGRIFLNRFAYFYLVPVFDVGLAIEPAAGTGFLDLAGRVTVLAPGGSCLLCREIVSPVIAREEALKRSHPEQYERQKREAYVIGGNNPAPAVVTFTTETACMAVNELLQGMAGYRGQDGWLWNQVRRFDLLQDRRPGARRRGSCSICEEALYWGRGDIEPFMDRVG